MWSDKESSEDYLNFGEVSQLAVDVVTSIYRNFWKLGGR